MRLKCSPVSAMLKVGLVAQLAIVSPLLLAQGDAFDEMESELYQEYSPVANAAEQAKFETWKSQQAAEYEDYKRKYFAALEQYKSSIAEQWGVAEVTDKKSWVEYSGDLQTKRVVDFEKNEIRISVLDSSVNDKKLQQLIDRNLAIMLQQTPNRAREQDPVLQAVDSVAPAVDPQSRLAILAELYQGGSITEIPDASTLPPTVEQSISTLKQQAVIKRPVPAKFGAKPVNDSSQDNQPLVKPEPVVITIALPQNSIGRRAARYQVLVSKNAKNNKLDPSLVYAIMHTESAFNPMARSHIPAYGLMQIVPESAGRDVARRLLGKDKVFSAEYLFDASNNVQAGATYINILYYSYLKGVSDPLSRLYCVIAAYNTGAGNVAKTFVGERKLRKALPVINAMTPQQVYDELVSKLPYQETREYLKRVVDRQSLYRKT